MNENQGNPFKILLIAVAVLATISLMPLSRISGGGLKDFNLLGDIFPSDDSSSVVPSETYIDPDLLAIEYVESDTASADRQDENTGLVDSTKETEAAPIPSSLDIDFKSDGSIEDYSPDGSGLSRLKSALSSGRVGRIAMLGDSYIEGDIFSQNIRDLLQQKYGGSGAGYVPVSSNMTGFRRSVRQTCSGWNEHDFRNSGKRYSPLSGFYFSPDGSATTTIKGSSKINTASSWDKSTFLFVAPEPATITINQREYAVEASDSVQAIIINEPSKEISLKVDSEDFAALGLYLDGASGISLDNMSIRGYSGIRHNSIKTDIAAQMREFIDYDLIILEYGINALTSSQTDYSYYSKALERSVSKIRQCYPNADILIMGIGDRGEKVGTEVKSMSTVPVMIATQRQLARKLGVMFWDIRDAMGGENSVVEWADNRDVNKDYIHLSFQGGERLGRLFVNSLIEKLDD